VVRPRRPGGMGSGRVRDAHGRPPLGAGRVKCGRSVGEVWVVGLARTSADPNPAPLSRPSAQKPYPGPTQPPFRGRALLAKHLIYF
jgi:hypothetical protein